MKKAHDVYLDEIISGDIINNPKRLWTYLKNRKQDGTGGTPLKILQRDTEIMTELLNNVFNSAYIR